MSRVATTNSLVFDRLAEFQTLARSQGGLPASRGGGVSAEAGNQPTLPLARFGRKASAAAEADLEAGMATETSAGCGGAGGFMRDFFTAVGGVQESLRQGRECVQRMDLVLEEVLVATTQDRQQAVSDELARLADETTQHVAASKRGLEDLAVRASAEDKDKPSVAERRIRQNMHQAMARKHQQLLLEFQQAQVNFKQALEQRERREMQLLCPDASPEELSQMIEAGQTTTQVVMRKMAGAHATILEEVARIRDKHEDILRLERSIQDLAQMFQEIAVLVDAQGEVLDSIENNVSNAAGYTGGGVKELDKALKIQHNTRKWNCCLMFSCTVLLIVVLFPVLIRN